MFSDTPPPVVQKRMSFLSVSAICATAVIITTIVSGAGLGVYGLRFIDRKSDSLVGLMGQISEHLPEFRDSLPPAILDAMDDERRPEYRDNLRISVKLVESDESRHGRTVVEIENKGDQTVSLLTMRIVGLDKNGDPVLERKTWAASPMQLDGDWRGPLLPKETRRFSIRHYDNDDVVTMTHEITDLRVWCGYDAAQDTENKGLVALTKAMKDAVDPK
ncbi:MAG: hypothetical protein AABZ08_07560 [Planctomycetota bacterium]